MKDVFDRRRLIFCRQYSLSRQPRKIFLQLWIGDRRRKPYQPSKILRQITGGVRRLKSGLNWRYPVGLVFCPATISRCQGRARRMTHSATCRAGRLCRYFRISMHLANQDSSTTQTNPRETQTRHKKFGISYFAVQPWRFSTYTGHLSTCSTAFGDAIKPVLIFVDRVYYDPIFDFAFVAKRVNENISAKNFQKRLSTR